MRLGARGHLCLRGGDRDTARQLEPFVDEVNGPLGACDGAFSFAGLALGFLALLTLVPDGLRGALRGTGSWRIGDGLPTLKLDLALQHATLAGQSLNL